jgi:hypothetical protein
VQQAYAIDRKLDDALPQSGNVTARYNDNGIVWAAGQGHFGSDSISQDPAYYQAQGGPAVYATPATAYTCYDNGNSSTAPVQYSTGFNQGAGGNCALSFKMQGGD